MICIGPGLKRTKVIMTTFGDPILWHRAALPFVVLPHNVGIGRRLSWPHLAQLLVQTMLSHIITMQRIIQSFKQVVFVIRKLSCQPDCFQLI